MNNSEFRRIVLDTPRRQEDGSPRGFKKPSAKPATSLGSRNRSSIPMTPRTVRGNPTNDFARQLADQTSAAQLVRKFRSSAAPKGAKLATGYTDRASSRNNEAEERDDKEARITALEEQMKLGQIEREVFERLRDEITGGDIGATHLVKGLDRRLLERVRRGEDVLSSTKKPVDSEEEAASKTPPPDAEADQEFEKLELREVAPVEHKKVVKKGVMAPPPPPPKSVAGAKRSRDDILAELKASRKAADEAKMAAQPQLGAKFRKVGERKVGSRIERDERGREVLITVDEDGRVKRKVRRYAGEREEDQGKGNGLLMPDADAKPLGMAVPVTASTAPAPAAAAVDGDDDGDIFENVGDAYNPLGDLADDSDSSPSSATSDHDQQHVRSRAPAANPPTYDACATDTLPPLRRNYFNDPTTSSTATTTAAPFADPTILAALKRAAALAPRRSASPTSADHPASTTTTAADGVTAQQRLLAAAARDRDMDDMDLGFGSSRFEDQEEDEVGGRGMKLSQWKGPKGWGGQGDGDEMDGQGGRKGGEKVRKRGAKKRRGDKDSFVDVMRVVEGRKGGAGGGRGGM